LLTGAPPPSGDGCVIWTGLRIGLSMLAERWLTELRLAKRRLAKRRLAEWRLAEWRLVKWRLVKWRVAGARHVICARS